MGRVDVSVIIPSRDRCHQLQQALASIHAQSAAPREIIVVDDGSVDGTADMLRREHPDVILLCQSHAGVSAARNRGIIHSTGEWIALLDDDDEWLPHKLERQLDAIGAPPAALVCHTEEIWIRRGRRVNPKKKHAKRGGWIFEHCLPLCCMSPSSILLHRSVVDDVGLFDEALPACEDYDLWLRIACRYPVLFIEEPLLIKHGGHDDQLSRRFWGMDRFRVQALEKIRGTPFLSDAQRDAVRDTLRQKLHILHVGADKRGKHDEARGYLSALQELDAADRPLTS